MSRVFGRAVHAPLEEQIQHGERLCAVLARLEESASDELGRARLTGRREEVETVLSLAVDDWGRKLRTEQGARSSMLEYLADLHAAARRRLFGLEAAVLDCCLGEVATEPVRSGLSAPAPFAASIRGLGHA